MTTSSTSPGRDAFHRLFTAVSLVLWYLLVSHSGQLHRLDEFPGRVLMLVPRGFWYLLAGAVAVALASWRLGHGMRTASLPLLIAGSMLALPWWPHATTAMLLLGMPAAVAWMLLPGVRTPHDPNDRRGLWLDWTLLAIGGSLLYAVIGVYFTESVGAHSGDEGHYLIQAESLYHDGDLDLRNNFEPGKRVDREHVHISRNSRHGRWYSWHPAGLPMVLAPTVPGGLPARHAMLGLIAGLGIAGLYGLSRTIGARRSDAWLVALLFGGSYYWGVYACRALPETLGATLALYGMIAVFMQERRPWASFWLIVPGFAFLPWVQTRFLPVALLVMGCYGLHGLLGREPWKTKLLRLSVFTLLCAAGYGLYQWQHFRMFEKGMAYQVPDLLFSDMAGLWHVLGSNRGILMSLPLFAAGLAALPVAAARPATRAAALYATIYFLGIWISSCSNIWFSGGASVPGRYLLVSVPVVMAVLAAMLDRASAGFRWSVLFLGLFSIQLFALQLPVLPSFNKGFPSILLLERLHPMIGELPRMLYNPHKEFQWWPALALYLAMLLLAVGRTWPRLAQIAVLLGTAVFFATHAVMPDPAELQRNPRAVARTLEQLDQRRVTLLAPGKPNEPVPLLAHSDRFFDGSPGGTKSVTSRKLNEVVVGDWISYPRLDANDWDQRGFRWATLVSPFRAGRGQRAIGIDAQLRGASDVELVIREGSHTRTNRLLAAGADVKETLVITTGDVGDLYILARFVDPEQAGDLVVRHISYSPWRNDLLEIARLHLDDPGYARNTPRLDALEEPTAEPALP